MVYALLYIAVLLFLWYRHIRKRRRKESAHAAELREAVAKGMTEPPSLHPVIDPVRCIGSASCVRACPEEALGIIKGKAVLTNAAACIGHGACLAACPVDAITLVFGTEKRGMDIPNVRPNFETNVPGIFIAGELGGMGLIRKAAEQGRQAIEAVKARKSPGAADHDVVIVGGGPAGISAGLAAITAGLRYKVIEQEDSLGGTVYHYPRNKIAMTAPVKLAIVGTVRMGEIQKELKKLNFEDPVGRQLVLTGGGAELKGVADYAQQALGRAVRVGRPRGMTAMPATFCAIKSSMSFACFCTSPLASSTIAMAPARVAASLKPLAMAAANG